MMPAALSITAVIPVYNGRLYLAEAIASVLRQTRPLEEIIVVDDGSEDGSGDVARKFGSAVRYFRQPRSGAGAARNLGVEKAAGKLLAFLDADDRWLPEKTERQLAVLAGDPGCDAVFGGVEEFYSPELHIPEQPAPRLANHVVPGYLPGTMLVRRSAFDRVGPFVTNLKVGEFIDWYGRAQEIGLRCRVIPDVVLRRRIHRTNTGIRERQALNQYARVLKGVLDRRRGQN